MDEYIKREDAIKAITYVGTADPTDIIPLTLYVAQKNIRKIPAADVVEVVRCKDCKYHKDLDGGVKCQRIDGLLMTLPDDYCCYGARKGGE